MLRLALKDVGEHLGAGWVTLEAIREEGVYSLEKLLQLRMPDKWQAARAQLLGEKRRGPDVPIAELAPVVDELQGCVVEGKQPAWVNNTQIADATAGSSWLAELNAAMVTLGFGTNAKAARDFILREGKGHRIGKKAFADALKGKWPVQPGPQDAIKWLIAQGKQKAARTSSLPAVESDAMRLDRFLGGLMEARRRSPDASWEDAAYWMQQWLRGKCKQKPRSPYKPEYKDKKVSGRAVNDWTRLRRWPSTKAPWHFAAATAYIQEFFSESGAGHRPA